MQTNWQGSRFTAMQQTALTFGAKKHRRHEKRKNPYIGISRGAERLVEGVESRSKRKIASGASQIADHWHQAKKDARRGNREKVREDARGFFHYLIDLLFGPKPAKPSSRSRSSNHRR